MHVRYEVWTEENDKPVTKIWGPAPSLTRAREVAQVEADKTSKDVRIDEVRYTYVGDPFPDEANLEYVGPQVT